MSTRRTGRSIRFKEEYVISLNENCDAESFAKRNASSSFPMIRLNFFGPYKVIALREIRGMVRTGQSQNIINLGWIPDSHGHLDQRMRLHDAAKDRRLRKAEAGGSNPPVSTIY